MSSKREGKETVEAKYFIASNKYSLQERQTKRGKVYDVMFRIIDPVSLVERQKKISGLATKAKAKEAYLAISSICHCRIEWRQWRSFYEISHV